MKLLIPKIIELDFSSTFIYLGIGKYFGFNFGWNSHFAIVIKGIVFSVWKFYNNYKWTRLCFALGRHEFAIRVL